MLGGVFPGCRLLCLRRRRSRLPWIYLVYQRTGVGDEGRGVLDRYPFPLDPTIGSEASLPSEGMPERQRPREHPDRYLPHPPSAAPAVSEWLLRDPAPDAGRSRDVRAPSPALPLSPSDERRSGASPQASG